MTREEAIKMLQGMKADNLNLNDLYTRDKYEALVMAIKALEQEPNKVCDWFKQYIDIPSNTVLIEFSDGTSKRVKRGGYLANVENDLRRMMQVQIERESYEDAIRPKGHWIFKKTVFDKFGNTVECSSCHKKWKTYDEIRWRKENKFCPNCGSDNRER